MTVRSGGLRRVLPHVGDKLPRIGINFSRQRGEKAPRTAEKEGKISSGGNEPVHVARAMRRLYGKCDEFFHALKREYRKGFR